MWASPFYPISLYFVMNDFVHDQERIDTLLALAIASTNELLGNRREDRESLQIDRTAIADESEGDNGNRGEAAQTDDVSDELPDDPLERFNALREGDQRLLRRRHEWYAKLPADRQSRWLKFWLGRALNDPRRHVHARQLDEHVHPSQIVEVLRPEPLTIRRLVLAHLPAPLNAAVRRDLVENKFSKSDSTALKWQSYDDGNVSGLTGNHHRRRRRTGSLLTTEDDVASTSNSDNTRTASDTETNAEPVEWITDGVSPESLDVVRGAFLDQFVHLEELPHTTALDLLSGAELARLVRLLGTRETAVACRGIEAVEAVASFLRRFAPEDARAIAAHMATLTDLTPERVRFAETSVQAGLHNASGTSDMNQMLDQAGLQILSLSLLERHTSARKYMWQKFPVVAADVLRQALETNRLARRGGGVFEQMLTHIAKDTESFAAHLKRRPRPAKPHPQGA